MSNGAHIYVYNFTDAPQDSNDDDFCSEHPYATAALAVTLIGVGTALVLPAVIIGIVGLGPGGVAAGQYPPPIIHRYQLIGSKRACNPRYLEVPLEVCSQPWAQR